MNLFKGALDEFWREKDFYKVAILFSLIMLFSSFVMLKVSNVVPKSYYFFFVVSYIVFFFAALVRDNVSWKRDMAELKKERFFFTGSFEALYGTRLLFTSPQEVKVCKGEKDFFLMETVSFKDSEHKFFASGSDLRKSRERRKLIKEEEVDEVEISVFRSFLNETRKEMNRSGFKIAPVVLMLFSVASIFIPFVDKVDKIGFFWLLLTILVLSIILSLPAILFEKNHKKSMREVEYFLNGSFHDADGKITNLNGREACVILAEEGSTFLMGFVNEAASFFVDRKIVEDEYYKIKGKEVNKKKLGL